MWDNLCKRTIPLKVLLHQWEICSFCVIPYLYMAVAHTYYHLLYSAWNIQVKDTFMAVSFVLCKAAVLFGRVKMYMLEL